MARRSRVTEVVDALFDDIGSQRLHTGDALPSEPELCERFDVSRVTLREAVKTLQAQGVVRVESGRGSFVEPMNRWTSLAAILTATASGADDAASAEHLIELRRMFETGAAALAASAITDAELDELRQNLDRMRAAHESDDVAAFVSADLAFHDTIVAATGNPFLRAMLEPLTNLLSQRREQTSRVPQIQQNALAEHQRVLDALGDRDPERARAAMNTHMDQTLRDLREHVLSVGAS